MKNTNDFQKLVCARIQSMSEDSMIVVDGCVMTKDEALNHVRRDDEIGRELIAINREYFDSLSRGRLKDTATG